MQRRRCLLIDGRKTGRDAVVASGVESLGKVVRRSRGRMIARDRVVVAVQVNDGTFDVVFLVERERVVGSNVSGRCRRLGRLE